MHGKLESTELGYRGLLRLQRIDLVAQAQVSFPAHPEECIVARRPGPPRRVINTEPNQIRYFDQLLHGAPPKSNLAAMGLCELLSERPERRDVFHDIVQAFLQPSKPGILVSGQRARLPLDAFRLLLQVHHHVAQAVQLALQAGGISLGRAVLALQGRHPVRDLDQGLVPDVGRAEGGEIQGAELVVHRGLPGLELFQLPMQIRRVQSHGLHSLLCILDLDIRRPARALLLEIVHPHHALAPNLLPHFPFQLLVCP
mmetsp:Transcript_16010/g.38782  ORF Transcript_16010/g.38782 Transcript_16010/m.38782 type:complete len:256 (+) Transcript_16010:191-958(+)